MPFWVVISPARVLTLVDCTDHGAAWLELPNSSK